MLNATLNNHVKRSYEWQLMDISSKYAEIEGRKLMLTGLEYR
jgi:hypothetical protein